MKYALIISVIAITGVVVGAWLTYPAYHEKKEKELNALDLEERVKGELLYNTKCAIKCHQELHLSTYYAPDKYLIAEDIAVFPTNLYPSQFWFNLLQNKTDTRCKGISKLDARTKELLYKYLKHGAAETDENSEIALKQFAEDIEKGRISLLASEGATVFKASCNNCHSENLARGFTSVGWRYQLENFVKLHNNSENSALPKGKALVQLKSFLNKTSASNETDAKIIRNLLRKLRKTDSVVNNTEKNNGDDDNIKTFEIPKELTWHDLDWQYTYDKGMKGLLEEFPDKPIIMELTNKYS